MKTRLEHIKTGARIMPTITSELMTRRQVAELFQVSQLTVIRMEQDGKLQAIRLGAGSVRYRRSEVEKFISNSISATAS